MNTFKTWGGIHEIINISKKGSNSINCIQIGKKKCHQPIEIANEIIRYFTSVVKQVKEKLIKPKHQYSKYLKNLYGNSFFITPANNEEVLSEIKSLQNENLQGLPVFLLSFIKLFQTSLNKPVALTANLSFSAGIFPANLKTAKVMPIFRENNHTSCSNYRPISLLSDISKLKSSYKAT